MEKLILNYTGHRGMGGEKIYISDDEVYFSKDNYNEIIYIGKDIDSDPWGSVKTIEKYKDTEFITKGDENEPTDAERFNYMMLSRLKADCEYYLNYGNRNIKILWADTVAEHIQEMKRLWNIFGTDKKPEWLTMDKIIKYEKAMN